MRTPGLSALLGCALACSGPPGTREAAPTPVEAEIEPAPAEPAEIEPLASFGADLGPDPLLAKVRGQLRGGLAPVESRRQLLESGDPDHRHAGRLLQAIADEAPEPVLTRALGAGRVEVSVRPQPPAAPAKPPAPAAKPDVAAPVQAAPAPVFDDDDDDAYEPAPKLSSLPYGGPVRAWFDAGVVEVEPEPERLAATKPEISVERLLGPELLLLRERPPVLATPEVGTGPRLVILTSLSLRGEPNPDTIVLELSGAGPATLAFQPSSSNRVRVLVMNAGAVPSFIGARPTRPELEVTAVSRRGTIVEIEVEFAHGWSLIGGTRLDNGASVHFARNPA